MMTDRGIPSSLEEAMRQHERDIRIPVPLIRCRFIRVRGITKEAMDHDWPSNNFEFDDPILKSHICKQGQNYGVMPKGGVCAFDCDTEELYQALPEELREYTLVVKSGRESGGYHVYFHCSEFPGIKIGLKDAEGHDLGDVRFSGHRSYLIGPGSIHPATGKPYRVIKDWPLAKLTREDVLRIIEPFTDAQQVQREEDSARREAFTSIEKRCRRDGRARTLTEQYGLRVEHFLYPLNPIISGHIIRGAHPIHGSENGRNFEIDTSKNLWHCYRCETGGDPITAYAVLNGIVQCHECRRGFKLNKSQWHEVLTGLERDGYCKFPKFRTSTKDLFKSDPEYDSEQHERKLRNYSKTLEALRNGNTNRTTIKGGYNV